jgi:hypothetical protein
MLQHAGIEISPVEVEHAVEFFALLGFARVEPPPSLAADFTWVEKDGTQIHLMHEDEPTASRRGHLALVVDDFDMALARLQEHGFEVARGREHWDVPRALAICPGGHRIELMAAPPPRAT